MTLSDLVARLGVTELARRAGVTPATLKKWLMHGASARGAEALATVLRRHETSTKAAATVKKQKQAAWNVPPESELPPEDALPTKPPTKHDKKKALRAEDVDTTIGHKPVGAIIGHQPIDSIYNIGDVEWVSINKPVDEVEPGEIVDIAWRIYQDSNRDFIQVKFLFFRYIPFNPLYRGEMAKKQGTWVEWWAQTMALEKLGAFTSNVEQILDFSYRAAETRVIYLEMIGVLTFDHRSQLEITRPLGRR